MLELGKRVRGKSEGNGSTLGVGQGFCRVRNSGWGRVRVGTRDRVKGYCIRTRTRG